MDRLTTRDVREGELAALCGEHAEHDCGLDGPTRPLPTDLAVSRHVGALGRSRDVAHGDEPFLEAVPACEVVP